MSSNINGNIKQIIQQKIESKQLQDIQVTGVSSKWGHHKVNITVDGQKYEMSARKFQDLVAGQQTTKDEKANNTQTLYGQVSNLLFEKSGRLTPEQKITNRIDKSIGQKTNSLLKTASKIKYGIKKLVLSMNFNSGEIRSDTQRTKMMQTLHPKDVLKSMVSDFDRGVAWKESSLGMLNYIKESYNKGDGEMKSLAKNTLNKLYSSMDSDLQTSAKKIMNEFFENSTSEELFKAMSSHQGETETLEQQVAADRYYSDLMTDLGDNGSMRTDFFTKVTGEDKELSTRLLTGLKKAIDNTQDMSKLGQIEGAIDDKLKEMTSAPSATRDELLIILESLRFKSLEQSNSGTETTAP